MSTKLHIRIELDNSYDDETEVIIRTKEKTAFVETMIQAIEQCSEQEQKKVVAYRDNVMHILEQKDIVRVYTENRKIVLCTGSGKYEGRYTLQELESILNPDWFIRISRFEIVNLNAVANFDFNVPGTIRVIFEDGSSTWVARRHVRNIEQRLNEL